jgi:hypothetical protein
MIIFHMNEEYKGPLNIQISWFDKLTMSVFLINFAIFPLILSLSKDEK